MVRVSLMAIRTRGRLIAGLTGTALLGASAFLEERVDFRESVDFLQIVSDGDAVQLQDFSVRTERSDGTAITLSVSGRFVSAELARCPRPAG